MLIDLNNAVAAKTFEADIVICGAGAAGVTFALQFLDTNINVILIESGGFDYENNTQELYKINVNNGVKYDALNSCRLRMFGGSTNHWGGDCMSFSHSDFKKRDYIPYSGWPINMDDINPYYVKSAEYLDIENNYFGDRSKLDYSNSFYDNFKNIAHDIRITRPIRFGAKYKDTLKNSKNITVLYHANLTDINLHDNAKLVTGLTIKTLNNVKISFLLKSKHYILAMGGIENARVLLNSNNKIKEGVGNSHDQVGRYFMEHPSLQVGYYSGEDNNQSNNNGLYSVLNTEESFEQKNEILRAMITLSKIPISIRRSSVGYNALKSLVKYKDYSNFGEHIMNMLSDLDGLYGGVRGKLSDGKQHELERVVATVFLEQAPNPNSRILLGKDIDELNQRRVVLDWRLNDIELKTLRKVAYSFGQEIGRLGLGRMKFYQCITEENWTWSDTNIGFGNHHMGTTRMSDTPVTGVVDSNCKVFGIKNLYIAGSSVFSTSSNSYPTLSIVALTIRLADHLKDKLKSA